MAINIKFDLAGNPEAPTIILANKNGNKLGQLKVNEESVDLINKLDDASEISFTVNKYIDGKLTPLWDKLVDFKLIYCKEMNCWFEIKVELDEETETIKTVFCNQLGKAELSQIMLHNIEINTEADIARDDYKIAILWDEKDPKASILDRMLEKAPHYRIAHVDDTIKNIQRSFSFNDVSIDDGFQDVAEEIGCLFDYPSNSGEKGKICRDIFVYDLQQNCNDCGHRGEFTDKCPKCGSTNIKQGYGKDTLIFVTSDELASEGIQLVTDTDSVKNCFKLEAGDDLMTATIRNCNPNGTDYIWYFSDAVKEDMSGELVEKINSYDVLYKDYCDNHESKLDENLVNQYNALVEKYKVYYNTTSTCLNCNYEGIFENICPECSNKIILSGKNLQSIPATITGHSNLMNAYYNTIDLALYLKSGLMPSIQMSETTAEEQAGLLTEHSLSPVSVNTKNVEAISLATANSAVLSMAKIIVKSTYKVEVKASTLSEDKVWEGNFIITNYSDENDTAESKTIKVVVNNDTETFIKQKIDKALNKEDTDDYSISGLFKKEIGEFCEELKKYALNPLKSFYDACDACLNILIDQGAGNKDENPDLYENLYKPYYDKSSAVANEIKIREEEVSIIEGIWDKTDENNSELITKGLQQLIEECRSEIQKTLDFEKYLGEELWLEFCAYCREDTYSNENYISDGLNNAKLFERALEFIEVAKNEIYKSAELQHSISTSLNNLLAIDKFKPLVDSFELGNWIRVRIDDKIFKLRLLEYELDYGSFENIPVKFSDVTKIKNGTTDVRNILEQASSMATSYSSIQRQADKGDKARNTIDQWLTNGLNAALVQVQNNNNEEVVMTKNGLLCRSFDDITGEYLPEQLKITHNIMAYTDDNWLTVRQAIGKHNYKAFNRTTGELIDNVGYGMSAEFVTAGVVSGSQIIGGDIYSDNYSRTNNTGSYINLKDGTFSFAGGSLRYDGSDLLISSPNVVTKNEVTEINEEYLRTTTIYAQNLQINAANIQDKLTASQINTDGLIAENISGTTITGKTITGGSILIGNKSGDYAEITSGGVLNCRGANITGVINATKGGTIAGFTIGDNAIYKGTNSLSSTASGIYLGTNGIRQYASSSAYVNISNGILTANGANITGTINTSNLKANGGTIGGASLTDQGICFNNDSTGWGLWGTTAHANIAFHAGANSQGIGSAPFRVYHNGSFVATNATISGAITANSGSFSRDVTIGGKSISNWITSGGDVYNVQATNGTIGGWTITDDYLFGEGNSGGWKIYLYPDGRVFNVSSNSSNLFFMVIYSNATPYGGISTSGWQLIYNG